MILTALFIFVVTTVLILFFGFIDSAEEDFKNDEDCKS